MVDILCQLSDGYSEQYSDSDPTLVLSHRDLNERNLLWHHRGALAGVVDWDDVGWVEPSSELVTVAMLWSARQDGTLARSELQSVINGYIEAGGNPRYRASLAYEFVANKLHWLHINMELSLSQKIDGKNRRNTTEQVSSTLATLKIFHMNLDEYAGWIRESLDK
jgi:aminoglycoside phosphotransferase (APT) family kinase protein